jgi:DNA-binding response OmpR family regulator
MLSTAPASTRPTVLWVDTDHGEPYQAALKNDFHLFTTKTPDLALQYLRRSQRPADIVIADLGLPGDRAYTICRAAKATAVPPGVLVTSAEPEIVPKALAAGCDAVLLKPFPPMLLVTRLNRLRALQLRARAAAARAKSRHLGERTAHAIGRAVQEWPDTYCPYCGHHGVMSFEYASHRKYWCACLACQKVWLAPRRHQ